MEQNVNLNADDNPVFSDKRYQSLVGKLIYLTITLPNITFPVSTLSQFMEAPKQIHWEAVCKILRHLKSTIGMGVLYRRRSNSNLNDVSLSDVDWTGSSIHKRSTSGYYNFVVI